VQSAFDLSPQTYTLNQLRYDLHKMKGHGLLERVGRQYAYHLTDKGMRVAALFILFHKRICGPLAHSLFHIEVAYNKADAAIQELIDQLAA
jgi:hypothetical protein